MFRSKHITRWTVEDFEAAKAILGPAATYSFRPGQIFDRLEMALNYAANTLPSSTDLRAYLFNRDALVELLDIDPHLLSRVDGTQAHWGRVEGAKAAQADREAIERDDGAPRPDAGSIEELKNLIVTMRSWQSQMERLLTNAEQLLRRIG